MVKNLIMYIFIYVFIIGCESPMSPSCDSDCFINIGSDSENVVMGDDGYYHMQFIDDYTQTFATLKVETGLQYWPVGWISNKEYNIQHMGEDNWVNLVNKTSYSDNDGEARTVLGVWDFFIGDTIKVYVGYHNECDVHFVDSLEVIVW
tara:strand:- start:279 stop:722 length:444 start_codon:yes stop_codon:yes gene_type:complete